MGAPKTFSPTAAGNYGGRAEWAAIRIRVLEERRSQTLAVVTGFVRFVRDAMSRRTAWMQAVRMFVIRDCAR